MPVTLPTRAYVMEQDGIYRVTTSKEFIGPLTDVFKSLSKFAPKRIRGILSEGIEMEVSARGISMAKRLGRLILHTYYRPIVDVNEKVNLVPVWRGPGAEMKFTWIPPSTMKLFLVFYWECGEFNPSEFNPIPYLVAVHGNRTYLLPMPNLYDDGRVCLGREERFSGHPAMDQLNRGVEVLENNKWNADLLRTAVEEESHAMFRFDPEGKQIPVKKEEEWYNLCTVINCLVYQFVTTI